MKKLICAVLAAALLISAAGCKSSDEAGKLTGIPNGTQTEDTVATPMDSTVPPESTAQSETEPQRETLPPGADGRLLYVTGVSSPAVIRSEDRDGSAVLARVGNGTELKLISMGEENACVLCESENVSGYISKHYLTDDAAAVCEARNLYTAAETPLYDSNGSEKRPLRPLAADTPIVLIAKTSGGLWYVNVMDTTDFGYVKTEDITDSMGGSSKESEASEEDGRFKTGYGGVPASYTVYYANVDHGYLAIRSAMTFDTSNELGRLSAGDPVYVVSTDTGSNYWYCYSPYPGIYGFVNSAYLSATPLPKTPPTEPSGGTGADHTSWTVAGTTNFLAVRTAPVFDPGNIAGKIYNGDTVWVYSNSYENYSDKYWWVYVPSLGMWGYVDSDYLER
ncbi:MAG: hypothetical protein IJM62_01480 [Lachnospiraceae bacterium]|nr:hypothetical protein [Lachnospiraceae bacterium]